MKQLIMFIVMVMISAQCSSSLAGQKTTSTNAKGKYVGKQDKAGRFMDAKGEVRGREDEKGRVYDRKGRYRGERAHDNTPRTKSQQ